MKEAVVFLLGWVVRFGDGPSAKEAKKHIEAINAADEPISEEVQ